MNDLFSQVFGHLFPPFFKNWWSDDWISTVYGAEHTFRSEDVTIKHNVNAQKTSGLTRYNVDQVRFFLCVCIQSTAVRTAQSRFSY